MKSLILSAFLLLISLVGFGQSTGRPPEFEVADIKLNKSGQAEGDGSILPSGQFRAINIPLKEILKFAYGLRNEAIMGAPGWVDSERYDIIGKGPAVGSDETFWKVPRNPNMKLFYRDETFRLMVQSLLAERLKMVSHTEQKPMDVFALVVAKGGPKLQKSTETGKPDCARTVNFDPIDGVRAEAICKNMTMADLARTLQLFAPGYFDRDLVDLTAVEGTYDFKLNWAARTTVTEQGGLTIPAALEKQLGLKLEERKLPMTVLIIDRIEKPSEN